MSATNTMIHPGRLLTCCLGKAAAARSWSRFDCRRGEELRQEKGYTSNFDNKVRTPRRASILPGARLFANGLSLRQRYRTWFWVNSRSEERRVGKECKSRRASA